MKNLLLSEERSCHQDKEDLISEGFVNLEDTFGEVLQQTRCTEWEENLKEKVLLMKTILNCKINNIYNLI